jgi:hypothetical protein
MQPNYLMLPASCACLQARVPDSALHTAEVLTIQALTSLSLSTPVQARQREIKFHADSPLLWMHVSDAWHEAKLSMHRRHSPASSIRGIKI